VPSHQDAVAGAHEVGLDEVGPLGVGDGLGLERVLGQVAAGAAVRDDEGSSRAREGAGGEQQTEQRFHEKRARLTSPR